MQFKAVPLKVVILCQPFITYVNLTRILLTVKMAETMNYLDMQTKHFNINYLGKGETAMLEQDLITASEEEELISAGNYSGEEVFSGAYKVDFQRTVFTSCRFAGCDFSGSSFYDSSFINCDFSNCRFNSCYFKNCRMDDCKGDGCDLSHTSFLFTTVEKGSYSYANFSNTLWKNSAIIQTRMNMAYFSNSKFNKLRFDQVNLTRAEFFHTPLKGVDLSGCIIEGITVSETFSELRGLKIDASQALDLALLLGVKI